MKYFLLILFAFLYACNTEQDNSSNAELDNSSSKKLKNVPELSLPLKLRCNDLPTQQATDTMFWYGKITHGSLTCLLKNKVNNKPPLLYTYNSKGALIDSIILLEKECYTGTDSDYQPWIEISKDLTISVTDTAYYLSNMQVDAINQGANTVELTILTDTVIERQVFYIDSIGKIKIKT